MSSGPYVVEPVYDDGHGYAIRKPYVVTINGHRLLRKDMRPVRFKDSFAAAVAGAKEVDRLKAIQVQK